MTSACLYKTHGKPCICHMENHVSTCMECQIFYKWEVLVDEGGGAGKEKIKGGNERNGKEKRKRENKGKRKRKRERRKRPAVSSSVL